MIACLGFIRGIKDGGQLRVYCLWISTDYGAAIEDWIQGWVVVHL
jgi:hypothetical protein